MNIKSAVLSTFILGSMLGYAQNSGEQTQRKFKFGIKGISAFSWNKTDNQIMENDGVGFSLGYGLMAEKRIENNYSLLFGFDVVRYKNSIRFTNDLVPDVSDTLGFTAGSSVYNYKYGVINIPLSLKMSTNQIGYISYYAQFGVEMGIKYAADARINYGWNKSVEAPIVEQEDLGGITQPLRMGLLLGGGLEWNLTGNTNLLVGFTFNNGFTNIFRKAKTIEFDENGNIPLNENGEIDTDSGDKQKAFARYFALNVGVYF